MSSTSNPAWHFADDLHELLRTCNGVTFIRYQPGMVLCYEGHSPQGLFVVLRGVLRIETPPRKGQRRESAALEISSGPMLFPSAENLGLPLEWRVTAETEICALLIPRSILLEEMTWSELIGKFPHLNNPAITMPENSSAHLLLKIPE